MVIRHRRTIMTAAVYVERAQRRGVLLRDIIARHEGLSAKEALPVAARRIKEGQGTFENVCRGRLKGIGAHINDKLKRALAREILREIDKWTAELDQLVGDGLSADLVEVESISQTVKRLKASIQDDPS